MEIDLDRLKMTLGNLVLQQILLETKIHELQSALEATTSSELADG